MRGRGANYQSCCLTVLTNQSCCLKAMILGYLGLGGQHMTALGPVGKGGGRILHARGLLLMLYVMLQQWLVDKGGVLL
jgi:hypothetical protein